MDNLLNAASKKTSSRMKLVKTSGTKPEILIRVVLKRLKLSFLENVSPIPELKTKADFVFRRKRLAVYVHGCFWHCCPLHSTWPKNNSDWWKRKLLGNVARDKSNRRKLNKARWRVVTIWSHEDPEKAAQRIKMSLAKAPLSRNQTFERMGGKRF